TSSACMVAGSPSNTTCAPRSSSARRSDARALSSRPSSATDNVATALAGAATTHLQDFLHVAHQFVLLIRLAEVAVDADLEGALAMLLAGTRGDHDDRDATQARIVAHVGGQLVAVHARHLDVEQHHVRHALLQLLD